MFVDWSLEPCFLARLAFNVSMVLFAVSYAVRDVVHLRLIAIAAGLLGLPYFVFCCGETKWDALLWNGGFTLIHLVRLAMLARERDVEDELAEAECAA